MTNYDPDAQRFRDYVEGRKNEFPVESDWREGYDARSDGPFDKCVYCGSHAHEAADCDDADESINEHLHED